MRRPVGLFAGFWTLAVCAAMSAHTALGEETTAPMIAPPSPPQFAPAATEEPALAPAPVPTEDAPAATTLGAGSPEALEQTSGQGQDQGQVMTTEMVQPTAADQSPMSEDAANTAAVAENLDEAIDEESGNHRFWANYFTILYGPSVAKPSSLQPSSEGSFEAHHPIQFKNFLTLGYNLTPEVSISGTGSWFWRPVHGHDLMVRDPYLRLSHSRILHSDHFNLYADVRVHFAVTNPSRENDLLTGLQTFQITSYQIGNSPVTLSAYTSARVNFYGNQGYGQDIELYAGPNLSVQVFPTLALNVLYEMGASHMLGAPSGKFVNDGTDLQPGLVWEITPSLIVNPYLNLYTGDKVTWKSSSFGMTLNWQLF